MISKSNLDQQLKRIRFTSSWGRSEVNELCNILMPEEEIDECVNGYYEAGFALLAATKDRIILVDKKPLSYLAVEDMRFDLISEFDYNHRLVGAEVKICAGMKTLRFVSWNQPRLRRLLGFVQYRITEVKKLQQNQEAAHKTQLDRLDQQLQLFLAFQRYQYSQLPGLADAPQKEMGAAPMVAGLKGMADAGALAMSQLSPGQISVAAMKRVLPVISAYTRLPWMSQHRGWQSSAMV